jgi:hypothetical protein
MEFQKGALVLATLPDDADNAVRRAKFIDVCDPDETVVYKGRPADAAWVQWLDGEDVDLLGQVPRGPLKPVSE